MPFRISSNVASITAQRFLDKAQRQSEKSLKALASGSRIANAGDDAAGFAISEILRGQISGTRQAKFNATNATSLLQTAEGGLNEQNNILIRLRELAVYAASDTVGEEEREMLDKEYQQLTQEFDRISQTTNFGNKSLLSGSGEEFQFQVGANNGESNIVKFKLDADTGSSEMGISGLNIDDKSNAREALEDLDGALLKIASVRSTFGAIQSRFQYVVDTLSSQGENLERARSAIVDVDVAEEVSKLTRANILQDIGTSVVAQANADGGRAIKLLNG